MPWVRHDRIEEAHSVHASRSAAIKIAILREQLVGVQCRTGMHHATANAGADDGLDHNASWWS